MQSPNARNQTKANRSCVTSMTQEASLKYSAFELHLYHEQQAPNCHWKSRPCMTQLVRLSEQSRPNRIKQ